MTNSDLTLIAALLDRSGSMSSSVRATCDGFDELIKGQKETPGKALVTLAQFDKVQNYGFLHTTVSTTGFGIEQPGPSPIPEFVYRNRPLDEVPPLQLIPRGMTPMLDATGRFITQIGKDLAALKEHERPGLVICMIMTDGLENASTEWSWQRVKELITQQREQYNWKFMFLGANIDAEQVGTAMGVGRGASITFDSHDYTGNVGVYAAAASNMSSMRSMAYAGEPVMDAFFDDDDRNASMGRLDGESLAEYKDRLKKKRATA